MTQDLNGVATGRRHSRARRLQATEERMLHGVAPNWLYLRGIGDGIAGRPSC